MSRAHGNTNTNSNSVASASSTGVSKFKFSSDVEDWLWIALPTFNLLYLYFGKNLSLSRDEALTLLGPSTWICWIQCVLHKVITDLLPPRRPTQQSSSSSRASSAQGNLMAMALIPSLVHAMAMIATPFHLASGAPSSRWVLYAKLTTISAWSCMWVVDPSQHPVKMHPLLDRFRVLHAILTLGLTLGLLYDPKNASGSSVPFVALWGFIQWAVLHGLVSQQYRFFVKQQSSSSSKDASNGDLREKMKYSSATIEFQMASWGEYQTLVYLLVIGFMEWLSNIQQHFKVLDSSSSSSSTTTLYGATISKAQFYYPLVAQSGILGCLLSVILVAFLSRQLSLVPKLLLQVAVPLGVVELCLNVQHYVPTTTRWIPHLLLPRCLQWLLEFFVSTEASSTTSDDTSWPRYWGVLYWGVALVVLAAPTIYIVQSRQSVVITRKWFHLVAIILFAPITHYSSQLMALGYAVALCGLLVLETLRRDAPIVNDFYRLVQDPTKDSSEGIILSHICLILGCAIPLWLSQAIIAMMIEYTSSSCCQLLSHWGILCLGVGDAMGAVVGKTYGRTRWGKNQRTVEGSMAMWTSMMILGLSSMADHSSWMPLLVATTFTTLLEAYTIQMDNLVLPLAGSIWILLLSPCHQS